MPRPKAKDCIDSLSIHNETYLGRKSKIIRDALQNREFEKWQALQHKGKGVSLFDECPAVNRAIYEKGLSATEWLNGLKMVGMVPPLRAIRGQSQDNTHCRHCNEHETLAHVLGKCDYGNLLITSRHHRIRSLIASALKSTSLTVYEEVHCISESDSNRRVDIIAFDPVTKGGFIIDPTVRLEIDKTQTEKVNKEKREIYEPCIPLLLKRYDLRHLEVIGLLVGARGIITTFFLEFLRKFNLPKQLAEDVALIALKGSSQILNHHLYNSLS